MRAVQVSKIGGPDVLSVVDLPVPQPKENEVVVKVAAAGVNYVDVYYRDGTYPASPPFVAGQEGAGTVSAVGTEVKEIKSGDRVAWTEAMGSYAEYVRVPADKAVRIPEGVTEHQAAAVLLQGMTAHYLCHDTYPLKKGNTALVHAAAGGVGLLLVQMARRLGTRVIGTVSTEEKAKAAREAGANDVILYTHVDFENETKRLTQNKGVQVVFDSVGKTTFDKGLNVLAPRGMMAMYGTSSGPVPPVDLNILARKGSLFVTRPSLRWYTLTRQELVSRASIVFAMVLNGELKLRINHKYSLVDASRAQHDLESRQTTGKLLLIP